MSLPSAYQFLANEPAPPILVEAVKLYGTTEIAGPGDNPRILAWAKECGISDYSHDAIAWCGLFMAICSRRADQHLPANPLRALAWSSWGVAAADAPMLGDVLTFQREGGGHVALYVGEDEVCYHVLGGNQHDQVSIVRINRGRLHAARRTPFVGERPATIRRILMSSAGEISKNER